MKRFINGSEVDLQITGAEVIRLSDRLMVRTSEGSFSAVSIKEGDAVHVSFRGHIYKIEKAQSRNRAATAATSGELRAPMPGVIVDVVAELGQFVKNGDKIVVLEAMKTQQVFSAPFDGVVTSLIGEKGRQVAEGEVLAFIKAHAAPQDEAAGNG